jgi:hypothetical protein
MKIKNVCPAKIYTVLNHNRHKAANRYYHLLISEDNTGEIRELLFTDSQLNAAYKRGRTNPEDIPHYTLNNKCLKCFCMVGISFGLGFMTCLVTGILNLL